MRIVYITTDEERYLEALINRDLRIEVPIAITNKSDSELIRFCINNELGYEVISEKDFEDRKEHDAAIMKKLDEVGVDLVILGGYRRLIKNKEFLDKYGKKMINIHNSFLPNFPGKKPHEEVFRVDMDKSGYTIHFVDEVMDHGEVLVQEEVYIGDCKNSQEVYDKLVKAGCFGLLEVIEEFAEKKTLKPFISKID